MNDPIDPFNNKPEFDKLRFDDVFDTEEIRTSFKQFKLKVKKLKAEDIFDFSTVSNKFNKELGKIVKTGENLQIKSIKNVQTVHDKYLKFVSTKERTIYRNLVKNRDNLKKQIIEAGTLELKKLNDMEKTEKNLREIEKKRLDIREKLANIDKVSASGINDAGKRATASEGMLGKLGGIGKRLKGFGGGLGNIGGLFLKVATKMNILLTVTSAVIVGFTKLVELNKAYTNVQATLNKAGFDFTKSLEKGKVGALETNVKRAFGGAANVNSETARTIIGILAKSPKTLDPLLKGDEEGIQKILALRKATAFVKMTAEETATLISSTSQNANLSIEDLTDTFKDSTGVANATKLSFDEAFESAIGLNEQLRSFTIDTNAAREALFAAAIPLEKMAFSQKEIKQFTATLGKAIAGLTPSTLMGLSAFTTGKMMTSKEIMSLRTDKGDTGLKLILSSLNKMLRMVPEEFQAVVLEQMGGKYGFGTDVSSIAALGSLLKDFTVGGKVSEEAIKKAKDMRITDDDFRKTQFAGFKVLQNLKSPIEKLGNILDEFIKRSVGEKLIKAIEGLNTLLGSPGQYKEDMSTVYNAGKDLLRDVYAAQPNVTKNIRKMYR